MSYGECVGPVTPCVTTSDCSSGQNCEKGRCACEPGKGELCLKNGDWECVDDPFPNCLEGILPNGNFGCCNQIPNWDLTTFNETSKRCQEG